MPPKSKVLISQLRIVEKIWPDLESEKTPIDRWLGNFFYQHRKRYGSRDRRFISETIYALFRHKTLVGVWLDELKERVSVSPEQCEVIIAASIEGFLAVEQFCELMTDQKSSDFEKVYASLRKKELPSSADIQNKEQGISLRYSFPDWLIKRWKSLVTENQFEKMIESHTTRPPFVVRANALKLDRTKLMENFVSQGYRVKETNLSSYGIIFEKRANLFGSEEFKKGYFEVQDEGSQYVAEIIEPGKDEVIWDVCAGGGGKSLALAALMANKGRIIATDIRAQKLQDLKKRAKRAGAFNIFPADIDRMDDSKLVRDKVDKILVDAPCSGTGTLRRNPDVKWKLKATQFREQHEIQVQIVENALPYLKEGGRLYYVTCSIDPEENDEVVAEILNNHTDLVRVPVAQTTAGAKHGLSIQTQSGSMQLWPHEHGTDGFFLAILERPVRPKAADK